MILFLSYLGLLLSISKGLETLYFFRQTIELLLIMYIQHKRTHLGVCTNILDQLHCLELKMLAEIRSKQQQNF